MWVTIQNQNWQDIATDLREWEGGNDSGGFLSEWLEKGNVTNGRQKVQKDACVTELAFVGCDVLRVTGFSSVQIKSGVSARW